MNTDRNTIFYRYWTALSDDTFAETFTGEYIPAAAVRLALRLAIQDAGEAGPALASDLSAIVASQDKALQSALDQVDQMRRERNGQPDQRHHEALQAQISRLNEWLEVNATDQYFADNDTATAVIVVLNSQRQQIADLNDQLVHLDADNADLLYKVQQAQQEIDRLTRQNVIAVDAFNSLSGNTNGNGANPTPAAQSGVSDWGRNHPAFHALPTADLAAIDQLSSGSIKFRNLSKTLRRDLVHRVIRNLAVDGQLGSTKYDQQRPQWMPTSGAVIMLSSHGRWPSLLADALNQSQPQPEEAN